ELPPADGIEIAKQVDDFGMPGPPEVAGQCPAFVVERLGRQFARDERVRLRNNRRINSRHTRVLLGLELNGKCDGPLALARQTARTLMLLSALRARCQATSGKQPPQSRGGVAVGAISPPLSD